MHPYQADLEKREKDQAEDKKVRALADRARVQMWVTNDAEIEDLKKQLECQEAEMDYLKKRLQDTELEDLQKLAEAEETLQVERQRRIVLQSDFQEQLLSAEELEGEMVHVRSSAPPSAPRQTNTERSSVGCMGRGIAAHADPDTQEQDSAVAQSKQHGGRIVDILRVPSSASARLMKPERTASASGTNSILSGAALPSPDASQGLPPQGFSQRRSAHGFTVPLPLDIEGLSVENPTLSGSSATPTLSRSSLPHVAAYSEMQGSASRETSLLPKHQGIAPYGIIEAAASRTGTGFTQTPDDDIYHELENTRGVKEFSSVFLQDFSSEDIKKITQALKHTLQGVSALRNAKLAIEGQVQTKRKEVDERSDDEAFALQLLLDSETAACAEGADAKEGGHLKRSTNQRQAVSDKMVVLEKQVRTLTLSVLPDEVDGQSVTQIEYRGVEVVKEVEVEKIVPQIVYSEVIKEVESRHIFV
jgi:hypothetical protein